MLCMMEAKSYLNCLKQKVKPFKKKKREITIYRIVKK